MIVGAFLVAVAVLTLLAVGIVYAVEWGMHTIGGIADRKHQAAKAERLDAEMRKRMAKMPKRL